MPNPNKHNVSGNTPKRRQEYDLSHSNHMSGKIGTLYPIFAKECVPGDKWTISPNFNIMFGATARPLQTRIKAVIDWFFVPLHAVWEDHESFFQQGINNTAPAASIPWIKRPLNDNKFFAPGSLSDYLGIPTIVDEVQRLSRSYLLSNRFDAKGVDQEIFMSNCVFGPSFSPTYGNPTNPLYDSSDPSAVFKARFGLNPINRFIPLKELLGNSDCYSQNNSGNIVFNRSAFVGAWTKKGTFGFEDHKDASTTASAIERFKYPLREVVLRGGNILPMPSSNNKIYVIAGFYHPEYGDAIELRSDCFLGAVDAAVVDASVAGSGNTSVKLSLTDLFLEKLDQFFGSLSLAQQSKLALGFFSFYQQGTVLSSNAAYGYFTPGVGSHNYRQNILGAVRNSTGLVVTDSEGKPSYDGLEVYNGVTRREAGPSATRPLSLGSVVGSDLPNYAGIEAVFTYEVPVAVDGLQELNGLFTGDEPAYRINAFYHRAYECIYNFWYRNKEVDYLRENAAGNSTDEFAGAFRVVNRFLARNQRNSRPDEFDYHLHHALLEKDMFTSCLNEPLVDFHPLIGIRERANSTQFDFAVGDGFATVTAAHVAGGGFDVENATVTGYSTSLHDTEISALKDIILTGITLDDIRNAESLKRWLSNKVQKGYNFSEQQLAQYGVSTDWNPLTSPSYLGSNAEWVNNGFTLATGNKDDLGATGGLPICRSSKESKIVCHVHDRGIIMGVLRVVPVPIYSQALDPQFKVLDYTEFFLPEYDNKGWEEVRNHEIAPLLAYTEGGQRKLNDVFGYNVGWHRYKSAYDVIHGDMRINFHDSVMMRDFVTTPQLSRSFIECNSEEYNDVFTNVDGRDDKFVGEIYLGVTATRPMMDYQSRV